MICIVKQCTVLNAYHI